MAEARPGDTVEVLGGEYREQVRLKSGVTLRSRVPRLAILRAAPLSNGPAVVAEGVSDARINGFLILADEKRRSPSASSCAIPKWKWTAMEIGARVSGSRSSGEAAPSSWGNSIHDCLREAHPHFGTVHRLDLT